MTIVSAYSVSFFLFLQDLTRLVNVVFSSARRVSRHLRIITGSVTNIADPRPLLIMHSAVFTLPSRGQNAKH